MGLYSLSGLSWLAGCGATTGCLMAERPAFWRERLLMGKLLGNILSKLSNGWHFKDVPHGQAYLKGLFETSDDSGAYKGISSSKFKKVVFDAHAVEAQKLLVQFSNKPLNLVSGSNIGRLQIWSRVTLERGRVHRLRRGRLCVGGRARIDPVALALKWIGGQGYVPG